jgi:ferrochelatase
VKLAVVLFNLSGPDDPEAIEPFLRNLFSDPAVIRLPYVLRLPLARFIAARRAPIARDIYAKIGGRSPILEETEAQAKALEKSLTGAGLEARVFVSMRCWKPFSSETAAAVAAWKPDRLVLLPLYPQFSTTTTGSVLDDWAVAARRAGVNEADGTVCCYPVEPGFIAAQVALIRDALAKRRAGLDYRLLFSAHGLPKSVIARGDPYRAQVEQSAAAIVAALASPGLDWRICFQSRAGPLAWIEPATDGEIRLAGAERKGLVVVPIAFVSEHSETLVELDIEYAKLAHETGVPDYIRVPTVGTHEAFIGGLKHLVLDSLDRNALSKAYAACGGAFPCCRFEGEKR